MTTLNSGFTYLDTIDVAGLTLIQFYATHYPHSDAETWRRRIADGEITCERAGVNVDASAELQLHPGDRLAWHRPPWSEPEAPCTFEVAFMDEHVLVLDKPVGLPVLPGGGFLERTLLHLARRRFGDEVAPVHRIDRGTSGLVLFSRTLLARRALGLQQDAGEIDKIYRARIEGIPAQDAFDVELPIRVPREHDVPAHSAPRGQARSHERVGREARYRDEHEPRRRAAAYRGGRIRSGFTWQRRGIHSWANLCSGRMVEFGPIVQDAWGRSVSSCMRAGSHVLAPQRCARSRSRRSHHPVSNDALGRGCCVGYALRAAVLVASPGIGLPLAELRVR